MGRAAGNAELRCVKAAGNAKLRSAKVVNNAELRCYTPPPMASSAELNYGYCARE